MAAKAPHVPKFGNWDQDDDVPYTQYFDTALKGKSGGGGKAVHPNNPQETSDSFSSEASPIHVMPVRTKASPKAGRIVDYGGDSVDYAGHQRRKSSQSGGGVRSTSHSPIRLDEPVNKHGTRGGMSSPISLSMESRHQLSSSTTTSGAKPNHARRMSGSSNQSSSVPKYSPWDESDHSLSIDGYAQKNIVRSREIKPIAATANVPPIPAVQPKVDGRHRREKKREKSPACSRCFCFATEGFSTK